MTVPYFVCLLTLALPTRIMLQLAQFTAGERLAHGSLQMLVVQGQAGES